MKSLIPIQKTKNNHDIDAMIEFEHEKIKQTAYVNGKNNGMKDIPLPLAKGDKIIHFIGGIKASYEQLVLKALQKILPASHLPEGRIERDHAEIHNKRLADEIAKLKKKIDLLKHELGDRDPSDLLSKIKKAHWICILFFLAETGFNMAAFEVIGDNMITCLLISASVAFVVSLGAHIAGRKYKDAKDKSQRNKVLVFSAIGIAVVSGVIAYLRSIFFQKMGIDINPLWLTLLNVAFFVVAAIATWYWHPSTEEINQNEEVIKLYNKIQKLKAEKKEKEEEQIEHENTTKDKLTHNLRSILYAEYTVARIERLYMESVGEFKSANLLCRQDVPDCFADEILLLDIPHITFKNTINKFKDENDNHNPAA